MAGKKRPRSTNGDQLQDGSVRKSSKSASKSKNNKRGNKKPSDQKETMEDWIANLAKQSSSSASSIQPQVLNKESRKQKRAAKQQRRQERKNGSMNGDVACQTGDKKMDVAVAAHQETQQSSHEQQKRGSTTTTISRKRLRTLAMICKEIAKQHKQTVKRPQPFDGFAVKKRKRGQLKWDDATIQPRANDYGGLGLALPSLFLPLEDPSFVPRLEEEFQEHIDGFFGKQRTKAMKKQLDGNMLWRQLRDNKNKATAKVNGQKLSKMTPDQRVEAMLKAGLL